MAPPQVVVRFIIEMLGAPSDYIEQTLRKYMEKLEADGLHVRKKEFSEAQPQGSLFTCFVEAIAEFPKLESLTSFCFESMPSSVEILEPDMISVKAFDFSNDLNDVLGRLHEVEMQLKRTRSTAELLDRNSLELIRNFIQYVVKDRLMTPEEIGPVVGVNVQDLKPFLDKMVEENRLSARDGRYFLETKVEPPRSSPVS